MSISQVWDRAEGQDHGAGRDEDVRALFFVLTPPDANLLMTLMTPQFSFLLCFCSATAGNLGGWELLTLVVGTSAAALEKKKGWGAPSLCKNTTLHVL